MITTIKVNQHAWQNEPPEPLAVNPATNKIYALADWGMDIAVINGTTNQLISTINLPTYSYSPYGYYPYASDIALDPQTNTIYLLTNNLIFAINGTTDSIEKSFSWNKSSHEGIGVNPNTNKIYVSNSDSSISVIDGVTDQGIVNMSSTTYGFVLVNPVTDKIYVSDAAGGNYVAVLNDKTNTISIVQVGQNPYGIGINTNTNKIYVGNSGSATVSVIDGSSSSTSTVPSAPQNLQATAGNSQISLSWTAPASNGGSAITSYNVYRGTTAGAESSTPIASTSSTTYNDTGLTNGQTYYYTVKAVNSVGTSPASNEASATPKDPATIPSPPTSLTATAVSSSQINLSWTAPSNNGGSPITGYKIERSADGSTSWSTIVPNTGTTGTTYSDTGLVASTAYTYRVSAINSVGTSVPSNTASATTSATSSNPTQVSISVNSVDLCGNPITGLWTILRYTNGTTVTQGYTPASFNVMSDIKYVAHVGNYGSTVFNHWNGGNTTSYYTITPTQNATLTAYYTTGSTCTTATAPQPPTGLTATATSSSQINLSWTSANNGGSAITGYKIERSTDSGTTWSAIVSNTGSTSTTYSDTGLTASTAYTYRVSAINSIGTSSPSNTASATTPSAATAPQPPTGLTATGGNAQVTLSWTVPSSNGGSAITGYNIYRGTVSGSEGATPVGTVSGSTLTYNDTGLTNSQEYFYKITAVNSVGESSPSNEASTTPAAASTAPQPPTGLAATASSSSQINLSWTAPSNNGGSAITGYKIERSNDTGTTWSTIQSNTGSTATTYSDIGLSSSTSYTYRVSAINSVGTSVPSNTSSATTPSAASPPTSPTQVTISVNSVDLSGKPITGMWTILRYTNGTTVTQGYTPASFNVMSGTTYVVHVGNYGTTIFDHWSNGNTTSYYTITPTQNVTLTAYYRT
ncbi:MAG: fibronectin type III domain-containing protein [Nitrosotalea sp.]